MGVFAMPSLGSDMEAATLTEWLVAPGDRVRRGDIVAVVETQKGAIEVEVFEDGVVLRLIAEPGETVPVGAPLAEIGDGGTVPAEAGNEKALPDSPPEPPRKTAPGAQSSAAPAISGSVTAEAPGVTGQRATERPAQSPLPLHAGDEPPPASPAARLRASELGLELASIHGTGPGGAILLRDLEGGEVRRGAAAPRPADDQRAPSGFDPQAMRAAIGAAMARSKREIPHYYLGHEIDLSVATDWLAETNAARAPEERLLMGILFVKAVARAVARVPEMNGTNEDGVFTPSETVNAGLAISLRDGGLVAPGLRDAGTRPVDALMADTRGLVERARTGRLRSSDMTGQTITISSLGDRGVDAMLGVIFPPQVALVTFGTPRPRPMAVEGRVEARMAVTISLSGDHRVSDGRAGARFLGRIDALLQNPEAL